MQILVCAHDKARYINGPNIWLRRLLPELERRGIETRVLFFTGKDVQNCDTLNTLRNQGIQCEIYTGKPYTEHRIRWILSKVNENPPDVFIPNLIVPAYFAAQWIKAAGIPTIGILHSDDPFYRSLIDEFVSDERGNTLSAIVCVSQFLKELCESRKKSDIIISRIPYGIPVPERRAVYNDNILRLIYAGRLVEPQKRISEVARALCKVVTEVPGTEAILFGSGSGESVVKDIIQQHGGNLPVKLGGIIGNSELQEQYLNGHIFVLLSDFEGLPIALMEGMACGLVPVCYNMRSGIPELIGNNSTGLIVNDRESEFVAAIKRIKDDKTLWSYISRNARNRIKTDYSIRVNIDLWENLIRNLVSLHEIRLPITIPTEISLPPVNPDLKRYDKRWPGLLPYLRLRGKKEIKSILKNA
jgi:colanic acid/amylovoran biosynthesis glycosyltransferase